LRIALSLKAEKTGAMRMEDLKVPNPEILDEATRHFEEKSCTREDKKCLEEKKE